MLFVIQKEVYFLTKTVGNFYRNAPFLKVIQKLFICQLAGVQHNNFAVCVLFFSPAENADTAEGFEETSGG
jgi:hypothetical protein